MRTARTLKSRLLLTSLPVITGAILITGLTLWSELSSSLQQHGDNLSKQRHDDVQADLTRASAILDLFIEHQLEQLEYTVQTLSSSGLVQDFVSQKQTTPLNRQLTKVQNEGTFDFLTVLDLRANVMGSFPATTGALDLGPRYQASALKNLIQTMTRQAPERNPRTIRGLMPLDAAFVGDLHLPTRDKVAQTGGAQTGGAQPPSPTSDLAFISATVIENDFGKPLGILIAGKLISRWDRPLDDLLQLTATQVAVFVGPDPVATSGFAAQIPPLSPTNTDRTTSFGLRTVSGDEGYGLNCTPLNDFNGALAGTRCVGVADTVHQNAGLKTNSMLFQMQRNLQFWLVGLGGITLIIVTALTVMAANTLTAPLSSISRAMARLASDDLAVTIPLSSDIREIQDLTDAMKVFKSSAEEQKRTLEALRLAKNAAEKASLTKSTFLSSMSHELRTPLNAILGFSQLLQIEPDLANNPQHNSSLEHILSAGNYLLYMIDQVLELSQIETGNLPIHLESISVDKLIKDTLKAIAPAAQKRSIAIEYDPPLSLEPIRADRARMSQVLMNVLSNAVKYNEDEGTITISFETMPNDMLCILVADTGVGIQEHKHADVFIPFDRLGAEESTIEGTGIGLTIARQLMEMMGGRIDFKSQFGVGSVFWLEIPFAGETPNETSSMLFL